MFSAKAIENPTPRQRELQLIIPDILSLSKMKPTLQPRKPTVQSRKSKSNDSQLDEDKVRYKLNANFFKVNESKPSPTKITNNGPTAGTEEVLYKFPDGKSEVKKNTSVKKKIKIKFWSSKAKRSLRKDRQSNSAPPAEKANVKKPSPKLRQKVSFLPLPVFTDQHVPMVTVPDDLTVHFNEEEANDLLITADSLKANAGATSVSSPKKSPTVRTPNSPQSSPRSSQKRKRDQSDGETRNDADLEYFAKYVVQKLRKMETNQRIYSENLINTVLMLGQLQKLNGKSKVSDT